MPTLKENLVSFFDLELDTSDSAREERIGYGIECLKEALCSVEPVEFIGDVIGQGMQIVESVPPDIASSFVARSIEYTMRSGSPAALRPPPWSKRPPPATSSRPGPQEV